MHFYVKVGRYWWASFSYFCLFCGRWMKRLNSGVHFIFYWLEDFTGPLKSARQVCELHPNISAACWTENITHAASRTTPFVQFGQAKALRPKLKIFLCWACNKKFLLAMKMPIKFSLTRLNTLCATAVNRTHQRTYIPVFCISFLSSPLAESFFIRLLAA